jgi:hypothetical protein
MMCTSDMNIVVVMMMEAASSDNNDSTSATVHTSETGSHGQH